LPGRCFLLGVRSIEFRHKLRLEAAACLVELRFNPCHVSPQACSAFGPNTSNPRTSTNRISVPKPTIHPLVRLWSLAMVVVVVLAGFSSSTIHPESSDPLCTMNGKIRVTPHNKSCRSHRHGGTRTIPCQMSASNRVFNTRILGFRSSPLSGGPGVQCGKYNNPPL
jgi:hypothetical protein